MPARSEAQRRFMFGVKGEKFARAHGYDNKGPLPKKSKRRKGKGRGQTSDQAGREELIRAFKKKGRHGR